MNIYQYLQNADELHFEWGKNDCCLFASNWLKISKGINPMEGALPYNSPSSALISISELYGVGSIYEALQIIAKKFNGYEVPLDKVQNGDIICYDFKAHIKMKRGEIDHRIGMGLCYNNRGYLCQVPKGLFSVPVTACHSAWRF